MTASRPSPLTRITLERADGSRAVLEGDEADRFWREIEEADRCHGTTLLDNGGAYAWREIPAARMAVDIRDPISIIPKKSKPWRPANLGPVAIAEMEDDARRRLAERERVKPQITVTYDIDIVPKPKDGPFEVGQRVGDIRVIGRRGTVVRLSTEPGLLHVRWDEGLTTVIAARDVGRLDE